MDEAASNMLRVLVLQDYNTRVVLFGTAAFGAAAGLIGVFLLLRKRSLLSDTVSHATLPGIAAAFLVASAMGLDGKSLPLLSAGAAASGVLGMLMVIAIRSWSRIKDDAAMAIVLGVFFGLGVSLTTLVQQASGGNAAGLDHFIYGKAASMTAADARGILAVALLAIGACILLFKEFALLCFDGNFAEAQGWPVRMLDLLLMGLVVLITVAGLQAVGLLLVVAMLIIPPAAARFWTHHLVTTALVSTAIGMASAAVGVLLSASFPRMPAGAWIVVAAASGFAASAVFGVRRGWMVRAWDRGRVARRVRRQHVLRAIYEVLEPIGDLATPVDEAQLLEMRPWDRRELTRALSEVATGGLVTRTAGTGYALTGLGRQEARQVVRNHRLWEIYLVTHADVAPGLVDRDADAIEHVIDPKIVDELEDILEREHGEKFVPDDPHGGERRKRKDAETGRRGDAERWAT
jgi:manganese/zinc/iron transport system permease protein